MREVDDPRGVRWQGIAWEAWVDLDEATSTRGRIPRKHGIYRIRLRRGKGLLYIGISGRLATGETVERFIRLVLRRADPAGEAVIAAVRDPLVVMHMVRVVGVRLGLGLRILAPADCCRAVNGSVLIDAEEYVSRVINASRASESRARIHREVSDLVAQAPADLRMTADGHDWLQVLHWYLRHVLRDRTLPTAEVIGRALAGCLAGGLDGHPLFDRIAAVACA
jgi:hypothetical protein